MKKITNEAHEKAVTQKLYDDAAAMDWEHTSPLKRTQQYERWLEDPLVGGVLDQWMEKGEMRVWLKDGPLKEFARARAGLGDHAKYLSKHPFSAEFIIARALGEAWKLVAGSLDVKPAQCLATDGTVELRLFWGPEKDFKHLVWAALSAWEKDATTETRVVVFDTVPSPMRAAAKSRIERIAKRANAQLICIRL